MTSPAPLTEPAPELPVLDLTAWSRWIQDRVDPLWRPGEWDHDALFFDGDVTNPRSAVLKCITESCWTLLSSRNQLCRHCMIRFTDGQLTRDDFIASYQRPKRRRTARGDERGTCAIVRGDVACARSIYSIDLCRGHYCNWQRRSDKSVSLAQWRATSEVQPLSANPDCIVLGCGLQQSVVGLCTPHDQLWTREKHQGIAEKDPKRWAVQAAPFQMSNQFSLLPLVEPLRSEFLYGLQQRDARGGVIEPTPTRFLVKALGSRSTMVTADLASLEADAKRRGNNVIALLREMTRALRLASMEFRGVDPTGGDLWELSEVGLRSTSLSGKRQHAKIVDLTQIRQPWLRETLKEWVRATGPHTSDFGQAFRACVIASDALHARPGGGLSVAGLRFSDMQAVFAATSVLRRADGELASRLWRQHTFSSFLAVLDFGRSAELLDDMSASFGRHQSMVLPTEDLNEDSVGKAVPEPVIAQLDAHLAAIGNGFSYGDLAPDDVRQMLHTAYVVLRDTGRRPIEVSSLRLNCVEMVDGEPELIWDNHKKRRYNRRLPITGQTAEAIRLWQAHRLSIPAPARSAEYLFPAITDRSSFKHLGANSLANALRAWVDAIPELVSDQLGPDGTRLPVDRSLIFPYAFRHSYAQRHADAGVPVDVLKELMDHRALVSTMSYYQVSLKRKREAVRTMRLHAVDRAGHPAPFTSTTAYEARSVAVPYGNCTEPSNVKAGGKSCPLRFQCSGCGFYRPDPSYLLAIEEHLNSLRADRETAQAMDADAFVVRNLADQIDSFTSVIDTMRKKLAELPEDQRSEIEEASSVLRKVRAARGHTLLPLTVLRSAEAPNAC